MRELQNTELLQVQGGSWGMLGLGIFSGVTTGLGFAGLIQATAEGAVIIISSSTIMTVIIALL